MTIEIEREDMTITLEVKYYPGCKGLRTLPNGDPGYPDDPDDIDIESVTPEVELTDEEISRALEEAASMHSDYVMYQEELYYDSLQDDKFWKT